MPSPLSVDLRQRVVAFVSSGASCREAASRFGVSAASASRWAARLRQDGHVAPRPLGGDHGSHRVEAQAALILATCRRKLTIRGPGQPLRPQGRRNGAAPGFQCALLVRRSIAKPTELTFYLTHAPAGTKLAELVRIAGMRWHIESLFEQAKGEVGLGHYEVRSWVGWHRHVTLAMFALAYLAAVRREAAGGCGSGEPSRRPAAADHARGQTLALASGLAAPAQCRGVSMLVSLAPTTSATCPSRSLA